MQCRWTFCSETSVVMSLVVGTLLPCENLSAISYTGCLCLSEYSLKFHFLHATVCKVPVLRISSMSACRQRSTLAEPVSILRNVVICPCREQQQNTNRVSDCPSGHLDQSSRLFALVLHLQRTVSAWIEKPPLSSRPTSENLVLKSVLN